RETIDAIARHSAKAFLLELAVLPVGKEDADHLIAHGELRHALTYRCHIASTIGHGYALFGGAHHAAHNTVVMKVQGTGSQPHRYCAGARRRKFAGLDTNAVATAFGRNINSSPSPGFLPNSVRLARGPSRSSALVTQVQSATRVWQRRK